MPRGAGADPLCFIDVETEAERGRVASPRRGPSVWPGHTAKPRCPMPDTHFYPLSQGFSKWSPSQQHGLWGMQGLRPRPGPPFGPGSALRVWTSPPGASGARPGVSSINWRLCGAPAYSASPRLTAKAVRASALFVGCEREQEPCRPLSRGSRGPPHWQRKPGWRPPGQSPQG